MSTYVTLSLYSGRSNPRYKLSAAAEKELLARMAKLKAADPRRIKDVRPTGFGVMRVVYQTKGGRRKFMVGGGLVELPFSPFSFPDTERLEQFLIGICPDIPRPFKSKLIDYIRWRDKLKILIHPQPCRPNPAADSQPFDEYWGATGYNHQPCNNCYDYANNQMTDTYSQPGLGSGTKFDLYNCASLGAAAIRDGLVPVANCTDPLVPGQGWYVALLLGRVGPEPDYHWVKQDQSGCWSHKLGSDGVLKVDAGFKKIRSPETASFSYFNGLMEYTQFCGYFRTHAGVTIKGSDPTTYCYDWGW